MEAVYIQGVAVHVPRYRLAAQDVSECWGSRRPAGNRAVANWDEDSVTMAVEAARRCLAAAPSARVPAVLMASTTLPYAEKQSAALVAEALDLPQDVDTLDVASSLRGGTQALRLAADRTRRSGQPVLVVVADTRATAPDTGEETTWGDAAAAILLGPSGPVELAWASNRYESWLSHWRLAHERYGQEADGRFVATLTEGLFKEMFEDAQKKAIEGGQRLTRVAVATAVMGAAARAAKESSLPGDVALFGPELQRAIGYTGTAASFLSLAAAMESADEGETVAWVSSGDGADAALATARVARPFGTPVTEAVRQARPIRYGRYLRVRDVIGDTPISPYSTEIAQWRESQHAARLRAGRCGGCQALSYPPPIVCAGCGTRGDMESVPLSRTGRLYTFTVEHLFPNPERELAMGVVELDDGVRFYCPITDVPADELRIGMRLRLSYRRLHQGGGFINYFWKATHAEEDVQ